MFGFSDKCLQLDTLKLEKIFAFWALDLFSLFHASLLLQFPSSDCEKGHKKVWFLWLMVTVRMKCTITSTFLKRTFHWSEKIQIYFFYFPKCNLHFNILNYMKFCNVVISDRSLNRLFLSSLSSLGPESTIMETRKFHVSVVVKNKFGILKEGMLKDLQVIEINCAIWLYNLYSGARALILFTHVTGQKTCRADIIDHLD